ncbi:hypothetical protein [Herbaspirillum sp. YR522]|uniref:hypothetical protein n=1 Tax=Herbaspirillum sp. YR522 TaxID=1144342 RepID=UPI00059033C3|nr:hypothetical protein [Herbaspirillum sp. YR522]
MQLFMRLSALATALCLSACMATTTIIRKPSTLPVQVSGLNILFVNGPMVRADERPASLRHPQRLYSSMAGPDKMRDAIAAELPPLLAKHGITAIARAINPVPGVAPPSLEELFPTTSGSNHLLLITPQSSVTHCFNGSCKTAYKVSLSLMSPLDKKEIALMVMAEEQMDARRNHNGLLAEMDRVISSMVTTKKSTEEKTGT